MGSERRAGFTALVTASLLVTAAANLSPTLVSALAVQIQDDLGIGEAEIGMTVSAFFCAGALCSVLAGRQVERTGPAAALRLAATIAGVVLIATAALGRTWPALTALVAVSGLANSLGQPAANLYVARGVPTRRQGLALGIQKSGIPTASLLGGLAIPTVALTIGWSWAFALGGVLALGIATQIPPVGAAPRAVRERAPQPRRFRRGRPPADVPAHPADAAGGAHTSERRGDRPRPDVPVRLLAAVGSSTCLAAMGSMALSSFFVLSSVEVGIDEAAAGILLMAGSAVGITARLIMGAGADRTSVSAWKILITLFAVASVAFVGFSTGSRAVLYASMPFAFATSFAWPGIFHLAMVRSNPSAPGVATGITLTGSYIGAVCGPLLFGLLVEALSYGRAWTFAAVTSGAAAVVMAVASRLIEHSPRS